MVDVITVTVEIFEMSLPVQKHEFTNPEEHRFSFSFSLFVIIKTAEDLKIY